MKRNWGKRMVSGTLAGILVLGFVPSSTFAVETDGLCAHHTQHTADCGYSAAIESSTCGCQPDEKGVTAHTEGCGYVEASEAKPCTFVCEECAREHTHVFDENQKRDCGAIGGSCGTECVWVFDPTTETLTVTGEGQTYDYGDPYEAEWWQVGDSILDPNQAVKHVVVEPGITRIGDYTFACLDQAESTILPEGLLSLGHDSFGTSSNQITQVLLPSTLENIETAALYGLPVSEIVIPESVKKIGACALPCAIESITFHGNAPQRLDTVSGMESVPMLHGITATAYYPANNPTWTENVMQDYGGTITWESYVPAGVIASGTCGADGDNLKWVLTDDGKLTISGEGAMEDFSSPPWYDNQSDITSVFIDTGVTSIGNCAFKSCRRLTSVTIPSSVTHIGTYAFCYCNDLTSIIIPDSVTSIGDAPFLCCASLQGIWVSDENPNYSNDEFGVLFDKEKSTLIQCPGGFEGDYIIPSSVTDIHRRAFEECNHLTNVTMPDGLCSVGYWAFYSCISLTSINIPDSVTSIESGAFQSCSKLASITIPSSVTNIGKSAFRACCSLQGIWVSDENPNYSNDEFGVLFDKEKSTLIQCPGALEEDYIIPDSVTSIGDNAFDSCNSMTSISIPDVVTSIGNGAFEGCSSLTSITIPDGVTSIKHWTFYDCISLTSINIPDSVTSIGVRVFSDCTSLTSFTIPDSVASIGSCAFEDCCRLVKISFNGNAPTIDNNTFAGVTATAYYPAEDDTWTDAVKQSYGGTITWVPYDPAEDIVAGGKCGENLTWMFDSESGLLTISGTGSMDSYSYLGSDQPWYSLRDKITDVMVENGVTAIGSYAFYGCKNLRSAQISDGVISLEASVFSGCEKITEIVLPDTLTDIGRDVFSNCDSLTSIILPDSVTTIGLRAFYMCDNLESVTLPRNLSYIGTTAFMTCPKLKEIYFRGDSCTIEDNAFSSIKAIAYYPANNSTWTEDVMRDYGGTLTWKPYCVGEHTVVSAPAIEATCTETGLTEGKHCSVCDTVLVEQEEVPAKGHTEVIDPAVEATCIETGLTEGKHCSVCDTVLVEQEEVPAKGHAFGEWVVDGNTSHRICTICGFTENKVSTSGGEVEIEVPSQSDENVDIDVDHVETSDERYVLVEEVFSEEQEKEVQILKVFDINLKNEDGVHVQPDGTVKVKLPLDNDKNGNYKVYRINDDGTRTDMEAKRQGSHMVFETDHFSLYVIVEESEHTHTYTSQITEPTCTEKGYTTHTCSRCDDSYVDTYVDATGHNYDKGTCTECGETDPEYVKPTEPESIPVTPVKPVWQSWLDKLLKDWWGDQETECDHQYDAVVTAPTCEAQGYTTHTCAKCGDAYKDSYTDALGHQFKDGVCTECGEDEPVKPEKPNKPDWQKILELLPRWWK